MNQGDVDAFVTKLNTNAAGAAALLYSTYLGGDDEESGKGIAVDASGNAYVTGDTFSSDFPTRNQYQDHPQLFNSDAFVTKLTSSHTVSGRVTSDGTTGIRGVVISVSGSQTDTTITDSNGNYSIMLGIGGGYTITPSKGVFAFVPSKQSITNLQADQTDVNFATRPVTISGKVTKDGVPSGMVCMPGLG